MALDFTLLTEEQIWGLDSLEVINRYGVKVSPTDLAVLLGGNMDYTRDSHTPDDNRTCHAWTTSEDGLGVRLFGTSSDNRSFRTDPNWRTISVRPVLMPSETAKIEPPSTKKGFNGIDVVEYGEYPQTIVDEETCADLEKLFLSDSLQTTGKSYTFDATPLSSTFIMEKAFEPKKHPEYEYNGKKYIRVVGQPFTLYSSQLSNEEVAEEGKTYWLQVEPIEWLKDPTGVWVSKKCLFAGIQFDTKNTYNGNFSKTFMKRYLRTYFSKEIEPSMVVDREVIKGLNAKLSEISDLEQVKKTITPANTPERTEELARIMRVRRAKELLSKAARKAQKDNDKGMLKEVIEIAKPYAAREAAIRNKVRLKRAERRAKIGRG